MITANYTILEWIGIAILIVLFILYTLFSFLIFRVLFEPGIRNKYIRWIISLVTAVIVSFMIVLCIKYFVVGIISILFN